MQAGVTIRDIEKRTCLFIDSAISGDRNVIKEEAEKMLNNKNLTIAVECMWTVKTKGIPIITGANGTSQNRSKKYLSKKPGKH
jgi:hypothetical protein